MDDGGRYLVISDTPSDSAHFFLSIPVPSLVGSGGARLSTASRVDDLAGGASTNLIDGSATLTSGAAVPEAPAWIMALLGLAVLGMSMGNGRAEANGVVLPTKDAMDRLNEGEVLSSKDAYFFTAPRFTTTSKTYNWLNTIQAVAKNGQLAADGP